MKCLTCEQQFIKKRNKKYCTKSCYQNRFQKFNNIIINLYPTHSTKAIAQKCGRPTSFVEQKIFYLKKRKLIQPRKRITNNSPALYCLNPFEFDVYCKYFIDQLTLTNIAISHNITQENITYHIKRILNKLKHYEKILGCNIENDLKPFVTPKQLSALIQYTTCSQQTIAENLNVTQAAVSSRLNLALKQIKFHSKTNPDLINYYDFFYYLLHNPQIPIKNACQG